MNLKPLRSAVLLVFILSQFTAGAQIKNEARTPQTPRVEYATADIDTIFKRLLQFAINDPTRIAVPQSVEELVSTIKKDGSWKNVDLTEKPKVDLPSIVHLSRLVRMAVAYRDSQSRWFLAAQLGGAIHAGLTKWLEAKPMSQNWWYNVIGTPMELARVMLIMKDELTGKELAQGLAWLRTGRRNDSLITVKSVATGQNLIWIAGIQLQAAMIANNLADAQFAVKQLAQEIKISEGEGVQHDWSFHQHGPQLYSGGYGLAFAKDCARLAFILHNTQFAFSDTVINILSSLILDCQRWTCWRGAIDYATTGREIARPGISARPLIQAAQQMAELKTEREIDFRRFAKSLIEGSIDSGILGHRHFWRSDYSVHRTKKYYASVKMSSLRTLSSESGNGEAETGYHLGTGSMFLMRSGKEYANIFPLWDWQKIPGVTNRVRTSEPMPLLNFGSKARGTTAFVGGVSDGDLGASAYELDRDSVRGKKAWFFFENEVVCLGAGIQNLVGTPAITTVNQCFRKGDISYPVSKSDDLATEARITGGWIHHDSILYVFPAGQDVHIQSIKSKASWSVINRYLPNPPEEEGEVFSIWLSHPAKVRSGYAYAIAPATGKGDIQKYINNISYKIIANDERVQAVAERDVVEMIFWTAGGLSVEGFGEVSVDQPCILMLRRNGDSLRVSAGNPLNTSMSLQVGLRLKAKHQLLFKLPGGAAAGSSLTQSVSITAGSAGSSDPDPTRAFIKSNWKNVIRTHTKDSGTLIGLPYPYSIPGSGTNFQEMYYWDTYFTNVGLILDGYVAQAKNNVGNMLYLVKRYGFMPNGNRTFYLVRSQPPYLSMMIRDVYEATHDKAWLRACLPVLEKEYQFWMRERMTESGLNSYSGEMADSSRKLAMFASADRRLKLTTQYPNLTQAQKIRMGAHLIAECESGWDFNPRFSSRCEDFLPLDLNCNLYMYEVNFQYFNAELGLKSKTDWKGLGGRRLALMNSLLYTKEDGLFYDYDFVNRTHSKVLSAALFNILWSGLASAEQAAQIQKSLGRLEYAHGIAACEREDRTTQYQWDYPNGWANLQYVAVAGLRKYGYENDARRIAAKYQSMVARNFVRTGNLWEKYNIADGTLNATNEYGLPPLMGWTAGVYSYCFEYLRQAH